MRRLQILLLLLGFVAVAPAAFAQSGKVLKVLPQFMDREGRTSLSPSLYDRDAYQARLRRDPKMRSGIVFFVNWSASRVDPKNLKLRVEIRGVQGNTVERQTIEMPITKIPWFRTWSQLKLTGDGYQKLGNMIAWRATLLQGDKELSDQRSFLW